MNLRDKTFRLEGLRQSYHVYKAQIKTVTSTFGLYTCTCDTLHVYLSYITGNVYVHQ